MVRVVINGLEKQYEKGTPFGQIAEEYQERGDNPIALVTENGKIRELHKTVKGDCELRFITLKEGIGHKAYVRSAIMLLMTAIHHIFGQQMAEKVQVSFAIGQGYYCSVRGERKFTREDIRSIKEKMEDLVAGTLPITKKSYPLDEAMALFQSRGMSEKEKLFRYRRSSSVNIYCLDGYFDYYYGFMLPNTSYLKAFDLLFHGDGLMLLLPAQFEPEKIPPYQPRKKLFHTLMQAEEWGAKMGIGTVGDLNNAICRGEINDMILVQEALQERRIGEIAQDIVNRGGVKFIMIAGPSSSGKTTFSHRLAIQLRTYGLIPHPIGLDDYFLNRENTPKDENGDYNFECLEAIDIAQFNQDMSDLLAGKEVELPDFNFITGKREYKGKKKQLGPEDILVIEGIHGLNPETSRSLPDESKYKIYISALTGLNIDTHNRIPTTDSRLIRRMVRDARTRGAGAGKTIYMWPSVRQGEELNIFPYQEDADAMFNSVLIYELAILKQYAEPLLFEIDRNQPEYYEAQRLLKFLEYFIGVSSERVPNNSICREFIGGSIFHA